MAGDAVQNNGNEQSDAAPWPHPDRTRRVPYQPLVIVLLAVGTGMIADR